MKRLILLTLLAISTYSNAQGWIPWQNTPQGATIISNKSAAALAEGSLLTIAYNTPTTVEIKQYNGLGWSSLPGLSSFNRQDSVVELIRFQGDLYLMTYSDLHHFDGQSWQQVQNSGSGAFTDIEIYNGQLVFGGRYSVQNATNMFFYNGVSATQVVPPVLLDSISDFHVFNNELYVASGTYTPISGISGLAKFDGTTWTEAAHNVPVGRSFQSGLSIFELKGKLYTADHWAVHEVRNDSIVPVASFLQTAFPYDYGNQSEVKVYNDTAYFGVRFANKFSPHSVQLFDGNAVSLSPNSPSFITSFARYQNIVLAFGPGVLSSVNTVSSMIWSKSANSGSLSVDLFWDQNTNCQKDVGDTTVLNQFISLNNGQIFFASSSNQILNLPAGIYTIDSIYAFTKFGRHVTPACTWPPSFTIIAQQQTVLDLPLALSPVNDLSVDIVGTRGWRSLFGFKEGYVAIVRNIGGITQTNVSLTVEYDQNLTFYGTNPAASITGLGTATWTIPQIKPLQQMAFFVELSTNSSFSLGDSLTFIASVSDQGDVFVKDNRDTTIQSVVGAFDPNDKRASVDRVRPGTKSVDYHIRFQNTGTDTAHRVTVVDSLDWSIPVTKVVINSASHPYKFSVKGKVLIWEFDNIMLPDSGTDYAGSQGYVRFTAGLNPGLYVGDTVFNDAQIYFDYQKPVHTKKAKTAVVAWISLPEVSREQLNIEMFPNPAKDELHIINNENEVMEFQLINSAGVVVDKIIALPESKTTIAVHSLSPGLYLLKNEFSTYKLIVGQ